jgi:predicted O-linked N-acetylglucosamine transferase (SPINDLY family)
LASRASGQAATREPPRRAADPSDARPLLSQALSLHQAGRLAEAEDLYQKVLAIDPLQFDGRHLLGLVHYQRGDCAEAVRHFDLAIAIKPDAAAYNSRAAALNGLQRFDEAVVCCDRALALKPDLPEALTNRGVALVELERFAEALASYDRAIALRPDHGEAFNNRANVLNRLQRFDEALESAERAIALMPDLAQAHYNCGIALHELKRVEEALARYDSAVARAPDHAEAFVNRGTALVDLKRYDDACMSYARALTLDPGQKYLKGMHLHARMLICDWTSFDELGAELIRAVGEGALASMPFHLLPCSSDPQIQLACAKSFTQDKIGRSFVPLWRGERYSHGRIRLAYLSSDFGDHAVSQLAAGLFERHDRSRFETIAISSGPAARSAMRVRLEGAFERFVDAGALGDLEVARLVRDLEIDVAVDLTGMTEGARLGVFARHPAPV